MADAHTPGPDPGPSWLDTLTGVLAEAEGLPAAGGPALAGEAADGLLALARDVAHASGDRRNAPLACYLLGRWVERRVAAGASEEAALVGARLAVSRALGA